MLRAVALASRLDFTIDRPILDAIGRLRHDIARSSPPRLLEEYFKILRAGSSERTFRWLAELGLLEPISAELHRGAAQSLWKSLAALDAYRRKSEAIPDTLTNAILLGSLLVPLGLLSDQGRIEDRSAGRGERGPARPVGPRLGELPLARRDIEQLRQILGVQRRLRELTSNPRAKRALFNRGVFRDALTWLEIHGHTPETVEHWKVWLAGMPAAQGAGVDGTPHPFRRRRRRRRRFRPTPQ